MNRVWAGLFIISFLSGCTPSMKVEKGDKTFTKVEQKGQPPMKPGLPGAGTDAGSNSKGGGQSKGGLGGPGKK